jgi:lycopene beta-cyclase
MGKEVFASLFEQNGALAVFKFLDEETSLMEEMKIMSTTPILTFGKAFLKSI